MAERLFRVSPFVHVADHMFHRGVAAATLAGGRSPRKRRRYEGALGKSRELLHRWSKDGPDFPRMAALLDAGHARLRGDAAAYGLYRSSAQEAQQQGFVHHVGLSARMLLRARRQVEAMSGFAEAIACYRERGALAKVQVSEREYATLLR